MRQGLFAVAICFAMLTSALSGCSGTAEPAPTTAANASSAADAGSASPVPSPTPEPGSPSTDRSGDAGECTIFPADNVWRAPVTDLPVNANSAAYVASIGTAKSVHADFGAGLWNGGPIGIPVTTVPAGQPGMNVSFQYGSESDKVPYPIPAGVRVEGGSNSTGDRHIILYDPANCRSYELFAAYPNGDGSWRAGSGAVFDLRGNGLRPAGWTSADAAGLSILAGLVRYEEVAAGRIDHAIRVTAPRTRDGYVWPARHSASDQSDAALPPMGLRLRLKSSVDISRLPAQARIVAEAMKRYGVILADNGSSWFISGTPDDRWDNDALHALGALNGSNFEAVDTSGMMISPNSAAAGTR